MEYNTFLIKYAEIGTKGKNRYKFEDHLCKRMRQRLKALGNFEVRREYGRIFVVAKSDFDYDEAINRLTRIFGISGVCPVMEIDSLEYEDISAGVVKYVDEEFSDILKTAAKFRRSEDEAAVTFKMNVRRHNKEYPINSMEMAARLGGDVLAKYEDAGMKVDVHKPEYVINVEIRNVVYIYSKIIPGACGLPVGTNGKAISLLSGGIDSPVATYMIAKRGVEMEAVYFNAPPYTSERAKDKVKELGTIVSQYAGPIKLHIVNFTDCQLAIYKNCPHDELTIIMKRIMFRMAEDIAKRDDCQCIVTGESIGQVSSQTTFSLKVINDAVKEVPVYRPLIGMDKQEIIEMSQKIGTYETSILPYEDCCTIFVAKHPVTKPTLEQIIESEKKLEGIIEPLYEEALNGAEIVYLK
ncbi:thiamine biosynthesis protein ThiI [Eubacterium ruminantium]|uniref:Probable tRNA sulfurtransferase n=1 Tax=Eubacterium ruminantium TaxID=42322 RepID=A0A1T4LR05_9FIRM|nr:tRNA uracil 4-sulfurtransferase ThiI [Eubacterium ruminantium]SCW40393.1 thiamine biosynthesis protein ThiI [Eubacterium ruminantium]SDM39540.1 thiamine biosynthesis protein ThiI [Eubacterium ruminantium]SJZ57056.1 thiamine biosynthesis protein ThiI [Eubacterium ruminantium]